MALTDEEREAYAADARALQKNPLLQQLLAKLHDNYYNAIMSVAFTDRDLKDEFIVRAQCILDLQVEIQKTIDMAKVDKEAGLKYPRKIH